jgi:hypothetical protein
LPEYRNGGKFSRMEQRSLRKFTLLVLLNLACLAYLGLVTILHVTTGSARLDGSIGVFFGLFVCSRPAANFLDMLLFWRSARPPGWTWQTLALWLALNLATLLLGWAVIVAGATHFTMPVRG